MGKATQKNHVSKNRKQTKQKLCHGKNINEKKTVANHGGTRF